MFRRVTTTFLFVYFAWAGNGSALFGQRLHAHDGSQLTPLHHEHKHDGHRHHDPAPLNPDEAEPKAPGHDDDHDHDDQGKDGGHDAPESKDRPKRGARALDAHGHA